MDGRLQSKRRNKNAWAIATATVMLDRLLRLLLLDLLLRLLLLLDRLLLDRLLVVRLLLFVADLFLDQLDPLRHVLSAYAQYPSPPLPLGLLLLKGKQGNGTFWHRWLGERKVFAC